MENKRAKKWTRLNPDRPCTVNFTNNWKETRVSGAVGAGLATILGLVFLMFGVGQSLTWLSYDLPFVLRPNLKPEGITIIYMDEDSLSALHQDFFSRWDRNLHARLLERLKA